MTRPTRGAVARCVLCHAAVATREQWVTEPCPKAHQTARTKTMHLLAASDTARFETTRFDPNKPYCGNCGAQDVPLRKLPYRGCDDVQHVCKDPKACRGRRKAYAPEP